ncbi:MAG TPA: hypothetical protein VFC09_03860 [Candidatus Dormibacteraeota bacterium]|nr:hypothetical protein [Candidatus Dormibacteraeota bacterium]
MKHHKRGRPEARRTPREIHVRVTAPRPLTDPAPDVWVVNGRVIRFLDPSRPDVDSLPRERSRRFGLLRAFAHR